MKKLHTTLLFDLDDTLCDSEGAYRYAEKSIQDFLGLEAFQTGRRKTKDLLGCSPSSRNRFLYIKNALEETTGTAPPSLVLDIVERYELAMLESLKESIARIRVISALETLASRYRLAILTNENTRTQMKKVALIDPDGKLFERVITSEEVGVEKPSQRIFEEALTRMESQAEHVHMIGNDVNVDLVPAHRLGMRTTLLQVFSTAGSWPHTETSFEDLVSRLWKEEHAAI